MAKRHLELTHEEIETINNALVFYYSEKLDLIKKKAGLLTLDERKIMLIDADKFSDLSVEIIEGEKDV